MTATSAVPITDASSSSTATRITNPQILLLLRLAWIALFIYAVSITIINIPKRFEYQICETEAVFCPSQVGVPRPLAEKFAEVGVDYRVFAGYLAIQNIANAVISLLLGSVLFWKRSDDSMALLVSAILINQTQSQVAALVSAIIVPHFLLMFPTGRFQPSWTIALSFLSFGAFLLTLFGSNVGFTVLIFLLLVTVCIQVYRYLYLYTTIQRQQVRWILFGFILSTAYFIVFVVFISPLIRNMGNNGFYVGYEFVARFFETVFNIGFIIGLWISVTRYRLWDIDLVINRSLVYGVLTILLMLLFGGVIALVSAVIPEQGQLIGVVLATVAATALFNPARKAIQNFVDRRIYRLNFDLNELGAAQKQVQILNPGVLSGKNLNGYEVRDVLGQGGMGEVYMGFGNGQTVAIKTMLPKIAEDTNMRTRFQREAQAGMQLDHPHIAKVYAQGEIEGTPYLVMDYIEGQDLNRYLKADGKLDEETARRLMQDICAALDVAHQQGFIHRDLKPANIMIKPNGQAVLMDFGITKKTDASTSLTGTGAIGTIDYMAPEQIMSAKEVDKRADIYALGVMLYEILTGEKPFKGSAAQILFAHLQQPIPDSLDINPDIPTHIAEAVERAMSKKPEDRFQSAGELAAALTA